MLPRAARAADGIFPQSALRFMDAERGRFAQRRATVLVGQPLVIEGVADFMQGAEHTFAEIAAVETQRDTAIGRPQQAREGMHAGVDAATGKVETQRGSQLLAEG